jgi:HAD superfamily hydrolase (TIGR01484 family)
MRLLAVATDYDGTLANGGVVDEATVRALERVVFSGRKLVLVTGRRIDDLERVFSRLDLFDRVVGENGALVYTPATRAVRLLAEPPPAAFVEQLRARGVAPLSVGRAIVATQEPNEHAVLDAIRALGLELEIEFNKGAVMVLPAGITKSTGLAEALRDVRVSPRNVVGVGDAENDHALLSFCGLGVAVANALPSLKARSDWVTHAPDGRGVQELVEHLLNDDLASVAPAARV